MAGISFGAHALALTLSRDTTEISGALLIMPAWTGAPGNTAQLTATAAASLRANSTSHELRRLANLATPDQEWILAALKMAWESQPHERLAAGIAQAALCPGPTLTDLWAISTPTMVVGLRDDPLHPCETAQDWAANIPRARYLEVTASQINNAGNFETADLNSAWQAMITESG